MSNEIKGIKVNGVPYRFDYPSAVNKAFGEEVREVWIPEQTVEFHYSEGNSDYETNNFAIPNLNIKVGDIFYCTVDDVEYECVCNQYDGEFTIEDLDLHLFTDFYNGYFLFWTSSTITSKKIKLEYKNVSKIITSEIGPYEIAETINCGTVNFESNEILV